MDLQTTYLGLRLDNPLIVSACPLTGNVASLQQLRQAGAAAAVLPSMFEEQIEHEELELARLLDLWSLSSPESPDYFPQLDSYNTGPSDYLDLIADAKRQVDMPIIASLNGATLRGWIRYAGLIEQAGADALELNVYQVPTDVEESSASIDEQIVQLAARVQRELKIPVAVKLGPFVSSLPALARALAEHGIGGLVLFNRFLSPDVDLEQMRFVPALELSTSVELRLALRWIAILRDHVPCSLAANGGVHTVSDVIKALAVGANVVACASTLLKQGPPALGDLRSGLESWLQAHEYTCVQQLIGSLSMEKCPNPEGLLRANYMRALTSYTPSL